jgi:hypothetical protein
MKAEGTHDGSEVAVFVGWEAVTAMATAFTALFIMVSGIAALRQLSEARRAQSFQGTETLLERWESSDMRAARKYVLDELPQRLESPAYREELLRIGSRAELADHPELLVPRFLERVGVYVYYGVLPGDAIYEQLFQYLYRSWPQLLRVALIARESEDNPYLFDKAELFYENMLRIATKQTQKIARRLPSTGAVATVADIVSARREAPTVVTEESRT